VLDTLTPAERLAFVLHDIFAVPFDEIAPIVDRSPDAARQLASRARRRVRGEQTAPDVDLSAQREVVDAFMKAAREGDFEALLQVLDPDVVLRVDFGPRAGGFQEIRFAVDTLQVTRIEERRDEGATMRVTFAALLAIVSVSVERINSMFYKNWKMIGSSKAKKVETT